MISPVPFGFFEALSRVARKQRTAFDARVGRLGLTYARARVLFRLLEEGSVTQSALASRLDVETATLVRVLDGMERLNLIRRLPDPDDRRVKQIVLTANGRVQADRVADIAHEMARSVLEGLSESELQIALGVFGKMLANAERLSRGGDG